MELTEATEQAITTTLAYFRAQPPSRPATDPAYLEIERLVRLHRRYEGNFWSNEGGLVRAACEWLAYQLERPATLVEVADFLQLPWLHVLDTLQNYPPVRPLIAYTLYLRAHSAAYSPTPGSHAAGAISTAASIVLACLDWLKESASATAAAAREAAYQQQRLQQQQQMQRQVRRQQQLRWAEEVLVFLALLAAGYLLGQG